MPSLDRPLPRILMEASREDDAKMTSRCNHISPWHAGDNSAARPVVYAQSMGKGGRAKMLGT
jgi:hypothetical protein